MAETERITVAEASDGFGGSEEPGTEVSLPVVELLTGRGFVTGKSGSGKSNSASVIAEKLLDNGFGLLIVDIDGEYYGLKEEYEILHAGGDEECDIQVTADHAEKIATLALEQNVPIILDVSSYLDESEAQEILTAVSRSLFAKAKKQKQPFLMLVEEVHEYIPENGSVGECGKMLIKIGKRGRKHGLGICGISQRPADVKKDFITQCDWLLWHRLTWNNDTKVVRRILDGDYATAVENLDDGEGFLMTDWAEMVQRVQFYRKQTFDAGATPGLDDFERPELKSVSDDLVSELQEISEEQKQTENRIAELREQLDEKNSRIAELETELRDARDLSRMAEQFVDALVTEVNGPQPGKTERERMRESPLDDSRPRDEFVAGTGSADDAQSNGPQEGSDQENDESGTSDEFFTALADGDRDGSDTGFEFFGDQSGEGQSEDDSGTEDSVPATEIDGWSEEEIATTDGGQKAQTNGNASYSSEFSAEAIRDALNSASKKTLDELRGEEYTSKTAREQIEHSKDPETEFVGTNRDTVEPEANAEVEPKSDTDADDSATEFPSWDDESGGSTESNSEPLDLPDPTKEDEEPLTVRELKAEIAGWPTKTRKMLAVYLQEGPETPLNAHFSAGGDGSRTDAYAHNRRMRTRGVIEHVGRGNYDSCLEELLADELPESFDASEVGEYATRIENSVIES
ncbi:MAG: DUF87 domain-containing protein [Halovenus sp.]